MSWALKPFILSPVKYRMIRVVGLDLSGSPKNDTGFCLLLDDGENRRVKTAILKKDDEIILQCDLVSPDLIAIDAPITPARNGYLRSCDQELSEYGTLPHSLRGMSVLVERGILIGNNLKNKHEVIEVLNSATTRILGLDEKRDIDRQKKLAQMLGGELKERIMKKDELDAISAALAGYFHLKGKSIEIGDDEGTIILPKV